MSEVSQLSPDSVAQVERVAQAAALAGALTPTEVVKIDASARNQLYEHHKNSGKPLPDSSALQRAGADAVKASRAAKAGPAISEIKAATPAPATPAPAMPAPAAAAPAAPAPTEGVRATDQRSIQQMRANADQRGFQAMKDIRAKTPIDQQTSTWKANWEMDWASFVDGRQFGETLVNFRARQQSTAAPRGQTEGEAVAAARAMVAAADAAPAGFVAIAGADLSGYTIPPQVAAAGHTTLQTVAIDMLKTARRAGIPQEVVTAYFLEELKS